MSHNRFPAVGGTRDVFYSRRMTVPLPLMDRAEGIRFWDENGREYIDASSGPMARQARRLDHACTLVARNRANLDHASRLAAIAGPGFERRLMVRFRGSVVTSDAQRPSMRLPAKRLRRVPAPPRAWRVNDINSRFSTASSTIAVAGPFANPASVSTVARM